MSGPLINYIKCKICSNQDDLKLVTISKNQNTLTPILECLQCGTFYNQSAFNLLETKSQLDIQVVDYVSQIKSLSNGVKDALNSNKNLLNGIEDTFGISLHGHTALDFGCGIGFASLALSSRYEKVYAVDFTIDGVNYLINETSQIANVVASQSIPNGVDFDLILSWHVFEHLSEPRDIFNLLIHALRSNGKLVLQVPMLRDEHVIDEHFIFYSYNSFIALADSHHDLTLSVGYDSQNGFMTVNILKG